LHRHAWKRTCADFAQGSVENRCIGRASPAEALLSCCDRSA
jgi:hypothetical protein